MKLNLGCGKKHREGFVNIDIIQPADLICSVGKEPLPFDDNSVDEVVADNFMEHLSFEEFLFTMNELHRVMQVPSTLWIRVPDTIAWPMGSFGDPTHKLFFTRKTFDYFTPCGTYRTNGEPYGFKLWIKRKQLKYENGFIIAHLKPLK